MTTLTANGTRIGDRFTLLGKLGEGGESEVWRARDHLEGREVALKILRPDVARRPGSWEALERQHEISKQLAHPLILRIDPPVRNGDVIALPMELAPGGDLRRLCGVSYLEIVPVLMEVTQALAHAHERGVIHRDLKAGNVLFDARGHVRLADFGAAHSALSPFTASPQQLKGEPSTAADDIYGLGALAYELVSGHPPFYPRFDRRRILEEPVPPLKPAHLAPGRLIALIMAMLAKQPRERPASMKQALEALEMALNDTLTFAYGESPDRLASTEEILSSEPAPEDDAQPIVSPPPRVVLPPAPERATPPEMPHEWPIPIAPQRATAPERRVAPERSTAPPPRPPLITSAPQARAFGAEFAPAEPQAAPHAGAVASSAAPQTVPPPAAARSAPPRPPSTPVSAPTAPLRARHAADPDLRAIWGDIDLRADRMPTLMKLEPVRRSRWPWAFIAIAAAVVVFVLLHGPASQRSWVPPSADKLRALAPPSVVKAVRGAVEAPLRAMQNASSAVHGAGAIASTPRSPPAEPGASAQNGAASPSTPDQPRTTAAVPGPAQLPTVVAGKTRSRSPPARASHAAGQRGRSVPGVESLLSDARAAESARDYSRAAQDYSQALAIDPRNAAARAGLVRANETFGAGEYSQAVGSGFAALGAGRLEEARKDFQLARRIDPRGSEAAQGLREVAAALETRDAAAERYRARNDLESRLQALVDDPQRLDSASVRAEAASLIREAEDTPSSGAVLRSLAARLAILLPAYDKPVHLSLVSDNLTEIKIPEIGSFGTFARREIDLKPGKYTVIGTRAGYQEVRRDVMVAPGQDVQTISVRCEVPI